MVRAIEIVSSFVVSSGAPSQGCLALLSSLLAHASYLTNLNRTRLPFGISNFPYSTPFLVLLSICYALHMPKFVLIYVRDELGRTLETLYVRQGEWGVPAGRIEEGELPAAAAARELLERTGYSVDPLRLIDEGVAPMGAGEVAFRFRTEKLYLQENAHPGERGGYTTEIRWH